MMCDPCFMDANQVGFVHELTWEDIKTLLDNAVTIKPKRQMSVQFSGGEPTISPYFLDAVRYAREVGYTSVQAATNGIEFAKIRNSASRPPTPACATPICSSTASATPPTRTARWATCSM
jgi:7,8-dihydro-6-hydroxymethylpterin dimethyltransferase